jgi:DNA polymerase-4
MDAFFASVEQRDNPDLRGKPIAVGGSERRGVVAAASYEARKYGVRSAMPGSIAKRKCPHLIFVKHRFDVYREVSNQIREIFHEYSDLVEPLSLDEAYLDVTNPKIGPPSGTLIAEEIRKKIFEKTKLTASAGVSFNKFLAKVASDVNKPNGIKVIRPKEAIAFIEKLPIEKFFGVGKVTAERMHGMGIHTGKDLSNYSEFDLVKKFGKAGKYYYKIVRAEDDRPVEPNRERKSIGAERTFDQDIDQLDEMIERLLPITKNVHDYSSRKNKFGRTVTLKIKTVEFKTLTRSRTFSYLVKDLGELNSIVENLLRENRLDFESCRLLGVTVSNFDIDEEKQDNQLKLM